MRARLLPWLLVLPALLFATPLSPLDHDPYPHLAGAGWAVLAFVPLALALLARGSGARAALPFLLTAVWALVAWRAAPVTDTLEARRALVGLAFLPLALAGGAALDESGRRTFQDLLVALSLAWTAVALVRGFGGGSFAGVLGDTGSLSQAALPGAAIGAVWAAGARGPRRIAGGCALALFLVHVGAAPVIAGAHTLLAGLLLGAWRHEGRARTGMLALAGVALLAPFVGMAARAAPMEVATFEGAAKEGSHSLSGLGVRGMVWKSALGMIADHPLLGAGPGQFQAAFPPYRDPAEIELSRHGVCSELDTEVEHAHDDWLQLFCELGLVGGGLFALGLALAARAALRVLPDETRVAAGVAALSLLVNAFVHAPLTSNSASAVLALALLGTVSGERPRSRAWGALLALPVLCALPAAMGLARHGLALSASVAALEDAGGSLAGEGAAVDSVRRDLETALRIAPDSVPALQLLYGPKAWERVLALRPHMAGAWEQGATDAARSGSRAEAHARYARALELSPTHPRLLRNAARLELTLGSPDTGLGLVERLRSNGCLDADWLRDVGADVVLDRGLVALGARLLRGEELADLVPEVLHAEAREGGPHADAAEAVAQTIWARQHAAAGEFALALRNYRQAAERSHARRGAERGPAPLLTLELAAAELRAGRADEARERVAGGQADAPTWAELPEWAREALAELGVARSTP